MSQSHGTGWGNLILFRHSSDKTKCDRFCGPIQCRRDQALRALAQLPPFSPILNRLIASLAQEDVSFAKISDLIEKDTALAGNVLRLVNSALYGLRGTVNSIRHAVSLLGIAKLRNATLSMSVARMWSQVKTPPGWSMARFNLHSVGVAILADLLTQRQPWNTPKAPSRPACSMTSVFYWWRLDCRKNTSRSSLLHQQSPKWIIEYELQVLGMTHLELSAEALAVWNLPEPIQRAVRFYRNARS